MPTLPDELLEEIFLRFPPDEPACLVRASLASKLWLAFLTSPAFHGRYREFHGAPPMLGFFYSRYPCSDYLHDEPDPLFVSTTKFGVRIPDDKDWSFYVCDPLDSRHGRVVLGDRYFSLMSLVVLDPMTGYWWDPGPLPYHESYGAAVLCAVAGCDHRVCHDGPFRVIFVGLDKNAHGECLANVCVSLPETRDCINPPFHLGQWDEACSGFHIEGDPYIELARPVLVEDALHFMLVYNDDDDDDCAGILKYDLSSNSLSLIDPPIDVVHTTGATILMAMEDAILGFAYVDGLTLYLWSRLLGSEGDASWTKCKVINLKELLPIQNPEHRLTLIGSVEVCDIIFVTTGLGMCEINLKTLQWKKLWNREEFRTLVPYMSFYNPEDP